MDVLAFSGEIVKALAWPLVVVVLALLLRRPLSDLLPLLRRFQYRDLVVEFAQDVAVVREQVDRALPTPQERAQKTPVERMAERFAARRAGSIVGAAWRQVALSVYRLGEKQQIRLAGELWPSVAAIVAQLERQGTLKPDTASIIYQLGAIRNAAAHAESGALDDHSVREYVYAAARVVEHLDGVVVSPN